MSNKKKNTAKREAWQKKQEAQGKTVVRVIAIVLILLAIAYMVFAFGILA